MTIKLPDAIASYYAAEKASDFNALAAAFADDATLRDEGATKRGPAAIAAWLAQAKNKYHHSTENAGVEEKDGAYIVSTKVSGEFPGSPVMLKQSFRLAGGAIKSLEIA